MTEPLAPRRKPNWFAWRDVVSILLALAVVQLVFQVSDLRRQLDRASEQRAADQKQTVQALDGLHAQLATKDARIKQLTDQLLANHLRPVPAPTPQAAPEPTPTVRPSTGPPHPSPRPSASPSSRPTPTPSPSPSCRAVLLNTCLP